MTAVARHPDAVRAQCGRALAAVTRELYGRGWMEGTAGNVSVRAEQGTALVTASGVSKGRLRARDTVVVDTATARPVDGEPGRPSAETAIHAALYRVAPGCGAVVHAHPPYATAASVRLATAGGAAGAGALHVAGFELIKGLGAAATDAVAVPVFANWADVGRIAAAVERHVRDADAGGPPVLLIAGHGITAWGCDLDEARNRIEALEALCHLLLLTTPLPAAA